MRQRIQRMRQLFVNTLAEKGAQRDFSFIIKHQRSSRLIPPSSVLTPP
ncbi:hypothetical protein HZD82_25505 [Pantoea agglomerans]|nr:hypothetical protein [Pantoea agglomerans]